jgi:glycosyltransferase involved in cell wall biosynthesis
MSRAMARAELDVLFFPTVYTYVPVATRRPVVVAIHDAIPERHPQLAFASRRARWLWTAKLAAARRQASSIVTGSETSKQNLVGHFGVPASRIAVVPEAPADCFVPRSADDQRRVRVRHGLTPDAPLVLHAGGLSPHKNLPCLVESLAMLRHRSPAPMLALAGGAANDVFHVDRGAIEQAASRAGVEAQVRFLGYVSDEDLAALYSAADVVAMVSLDEGFGLPAIEAMACGTPVVLSRAGSLPEVAGGAALLVDPHDTPAIAEALGSLIDDRALRASLARLGRERAAQFSWRASAERLAHVLQSVSDGAYG